jgi:hypothetical protein
MPKSKLQHPKNKTANTSNNNYYWWLFLVFNLITMPLLMRMAQAQPINSCKPEDDDNCGSTLLNQWNWDPYLLPCSTISPNTYISNRFHVRKTKDAVELLQGNCWQTPEGETTFGANLTNEAYFDIFDEHGSRFTRHIEKRDRLRAAGYPILFDTNYGDQFLENMMRDLNQNLDQTIKMLNTKTVRPPLSLLGHKLHTVQQIFENLDIGIECGKSMDLTIMKLVARHYQQQMSFDHMPDFLDIGFRLGKKSPNKPGYCITASEHNTLILLNPNSKISQKIVKLFQGNENYSYRYMVGDKNYQLSEVKRIASYLKNNSDEKLYCDNWLPNVGHQSHCTDVWYMTHPDKISSIAFVKMSHVPYAQQLISAFFDTYPEIFTWLLQDGPVVKNYRPS